MYRRPRLHATAINRYYHGDMVGYTLPNLKKRQLCGAHEQHQIAMDARLAKFLDIGIAL